MSKCIVFKILCFYWVHGSSRSTVRYNQGDISLVYIPSRSVRSQASKPLEYLFFLKVDTVGLRCGMLSLGSSVRTDQLKCFSWTLNDLFNSAYNSLFFHVCVLYFTYVILFIMEELSSGFGALQISHIIIIIIYTLVTKVDIQILLQLLGSFM